jgi:hypothetical protein
MIICAAKAAELIAAATPMAVNAWSSVRATAGAEAAKMSVRGLSARDLAARPTVLLDLRLSNSAGEDKAVFAPLARFGGLSFLILKYFPV